MPMKIQDILTERLIMKPITYEILKAAIDGRIEEIEKFGLKTGNIWPNSDTLEFLPIVEERMRLYDELTGFDPWLIILKDDKRIIGDAGFKGMPDEDGTIEIGYGLLEEERRKGYCFEAVRALINWALSQNNVKRIKADCLIDNVGSIRILQKSGFKEVNRDETMIYWVLEKNYPVFLMVAQK